MSCPIESDLRRYEEQLDIQARQEKYQEDNPVYYWHIVTPKWSEFANTQDEADEFVQMAKNDGYKWHQIACTKHIEGIS